MNPDAGLTPDASTNDPNTAPQASDDAVTTLEDTAVTFDVTANDTDAEDILDPSEVTLLTQPTNGTLTQNGGSLTYAPNVDFYGQDGFDYQICDSDGLCDSATVNLTITGVNDAPVAIDDHYTANEDTPLSIDAPGVLANDVDVDGDALAASIDVLPANGTVSLQPDGRFLYTPGVNFCGTDNFQYMTNDGAGGTDTANVQIDVRCVLPPIANADTATTSEDTAVTINVVANDSDPNDDLDPTTLTITTDPTNGIANADGAGTITYAPGINFNGSDGFTYQICDASGLCDSAMVMVNVEPINDPPFALDDTFSGLEDTPLNATLGVLLNDGDLDGDPLSVIGQTAPRNGSIMMRSDGTFDYFPDIDFCGNDDFQYTVGDGQGGTATAQVNLFVNCVVDPPVAIDDAVTTLEDNQTIVTVLANDIDGDNGLDPSSLTVVTQSMNGVTVINADGTLTYAPNVDFHGMDTLEYRVCDTSIACDTALVTITVIAVNDRPIAINDSYNTTENTPLNVDVNLGVLSNDFDPDGDPLSVSGHTTPLNGLLALNADGSFTYGPNPNYCGADSFQYTVDDGAGGTNNASVNINVECANIGPVAVADAVYTDEDVGIFPKNAGNNYRSVLDNDWDPEGETLSLGSYDSVSRFGGTVHMQADGRYTYIPAAGFAGIDTFRYAALDPHGTASWTTVTSTVHAKYPRQANTELVDWHQHESQFSGTFSVENLGGRPVQVLSHALELAYFDPLSEAWVRVPWLGGHCAFDAELPYVVKSQRLVTFSECTAETRIPPGVSVRVIASTDIFGLDTKPPPPASGHLTK